MNLNKLKLLNIYIYNIHLYILMKNLNLKNKKISVKFLNTLIQKDNSYSKIIIDLKNKQFDIFSSLVLLSFLLQNNGKIKIYNYSNEISKFINLYEFQFKIYYKTNNFIILIKKNIISTIKNYFDKSLYSYFFIQKNNLLKTEIAFTQKNIQLKKNIIQNSSKTIKIKDFDFTKIKQMNKLFTWNEYSFFNPNFFIYPKSEEALQKYYYNNNIKFPNTLDKYYFRNKIFNSNIEFIMRYKNYVFNKDSIILQQNFTNNDFIDVQSFLKYNFDMKHLKFINLITFCKNEDLPMKNFSFVKNQMKLHYFTLITKDIIQEMKQNISYKIEFIHINRNFYKYKFSVKQFILNIIFCITFQKKHGISILYFINNLDKALLDIILICKLMYKKVSLSNSYSSIMSNYLICEDFIGNIEDTFYIEKLYKIYENINVELNVQQIFDLSFNKKDIKIFEKYNLQKYKLLSDNYQFMKQLYYLLFNEKIININKVLVPIQINNFLLFIKYIS